MSEWPVWVCLLVACLTAVIGLILGYVGSRLFDRFRLTNARKQVEEIAANARKEAENLRKEAELKAKDELFHKRDQFNRELEEGRGKIREQERRLEKREDGLEQREKDLGKKERVHEQHERKLKERRHELDKKVEEAESLRAEQLQKMLEISGLKREEAEQRLLKRLETDLSTAIAARIQKHQEMLQATAEEQARKVVALAIPR